MRTRPFSVVSAFFLAAAAATTMSSGILYQSSPAPSPPRREIFVKFRAGTTGSAIASLHARAGGALKRRSPLTGWQTVVLPYGIDVEQALTRYRMNPSVEAAERAGTYHIVKKPNDLKGDQWAFHNTGQSVYHVVGTPDADIDAPEAWDLATGSKSVVVAVIDTGVDQTRGDLSGRLVTGYDFVRGDQVANDEHGHGTAVASVIGAVGNNDAGMTGLNWKVSIMPVKVCDASGTCSLGDVQAGIDFAVAHGADVINMSLACDENYNPTYGCLGEDPQDPCFSQAGLDSIVAAIQAGVTVVEAAGNCGSLSDDSTKSYPCAYAPAGNICAGSTNSDDGVSGFSDVGPSVVDIGAPGELILVYGRTPPGGYAYTYGTSFSSPMVAGVAALLLSRTPMTPEAIRERIVKGGEDRFGPFLVYSFEGGRLNAFNTLKDVFLPPVPYSVDPPADVNLLADVNRDGRADLIRGTAGTGFHVSLASGSKPKFKASALWTATSPQSVVLAGDVDGDGRADLILGEAGTGFQVLRSNGTAFLPPEAASASDPGSLNAVGDFNGDGLADVVRHTGDFEVMLAGAGATFGSPAVWSTAGAGDAIAAADLNGDGRDDLVSWTDTQNDSQIDVALSTGTGFGTLTRWIDASPLHPNSDLAFAGAGDFDGDGKDDLLAIDSISGCLMVLRSAGSDLENPRPWICAGPFEVTLVGRTDLSRDTRADVVVHASAGGWHLLRSQL